MTEARRMTAAERLVLAAATRIAIGGAKPAQDAMIALAAPALQRIDALAAEPFWAVRRHLEDIAAAEDWMEVQRARFRLQAVLEAYFEERALAAREALDG